MSIISTPTKNKTKNMPKTQEQRDAQNLAYIKTSCFPILELKENVKRLSPFDKIQTRTINIVPGKNPRLQFKVENPAKVERLVDVMVKIHNKEIHINKKSFENVVEQFKETDEALNVYMFDIGQPDLAELVANVEAQIEQA